MVAATIWPNLAPPIPPHEGFTAPTDAAARRSEAIGWVGVSLLIIVTLGGIWLGYVTPTEGSALGLAGSIMLATAKGMSKQRLIESFVDAGKTTTPILLLLLCAMIY